MEIAAIMQTKNKKTDKRRDKRDKFGFEITNIYLKSSDSVKERALSKQ